MALYVFVSLFLIIMNNSEAPIPQTDLRSHYLHPCWELSSCTHFRRGGTAAKGLRQASCVNFEVFLGFLMIKIESSVWIDC